MGMTIHIVGQTTLINWLFSKPNWRDGKLLFRAYQSARFQRVDRRSTRGFIPKILHNPEECKNQ